MDPVHPFPRRRLFCLALAVLLSSCFERTLAAELPDAPIPQIAGAATPAANASVSGFIVDRDGDAIPAARVTLTRDAAPASPLVFTTSNDGRFTFANILPGPFSVDIAATGFAPHQASFTLQPGEDRELPDISLTSATTTSIEVQADQSKIADAQVKQEEKQRVLGAIPNFYVVYDTNPVPLNPRQKSDLAFKSIIDPVNFIITGVIAGVQQGTDTYNWQQGADGYAKRYTASFGTFLTGDILGNAILPILFKQDPRYYYKGKGSIHSRIGYAIANSVVCKGDNGHWQLNYSAILGGLAASAISNLYYPAPNRDGASLTFESAAIGTGFSAASNIIQEFLVRKLTPRLPPIPTNP